MKTKVPVAEMKGVKENAINEYWMKYYCGNVLCSLCGNKGIIDTRLTAREGRLNYCICPNGRKMRENSKDYPLQIKANIIVNGMRFEVNKPTIYYEDVVKLAFGDNNRNDYSMTYSSNNGGGILHKNEGVPVGPEMYFTVVLTNNA